MAKQLNLIQNGQVIPTALHTEMQQSYLEYAMSVIVGRALPDVRDGLKPVHRRIVYAMHELGLTPDRPYRKCARVVGDVLGKYHPHGDQAVYDALVRLVQDFSSRYPLLAGHGNFGSVDDDPPAAMRYTETRLAQIGNEGLLSEIGEATVNFIGNFDNSQQEPTVLPAQLPFLILNGSSGIAVGMATNIPPHNLGEVVDGLIALIDRPQLSDEQLLEIIPGPDFPTGGEIVGKEGIRDAYTTGRGSIPMRGIAQVEEVPVGKGRQRRTAIVITELPYQVNKAGLIEKMADLVNQGRIEGIADIRDESDRDGMRIVIELKRDVNPQLVLHHLYKQTPLQTNFGAILLALVDGQPRQLTLKQLLQHFLDFREVTLTRQYINELSQAQSRAHLVEGLLTALSHLDPVIEILRHAPDGTTAKISLQNELNLSDRQADAILSMPMRRLTGLERQNLQTEYDELTSRMQNLQRLLGDRHELLKALKKDFRALKKKHGDVRRTRIAGSSSVTTTPEEELLAETPSTEEETVLELTQRGYVRRLSVKAFQRQNRGKPDSSVSTKPEESSDAVNQTLWTNTAQELLVVTRSGKAYTIKVGDIPVSAGRNAKGTPLVTLLPNAAQGDPETISAQLLIPEHVEELSLVMLTQQGRAKRVPLSEFTNLTSRGLTALKLKDDDELVYACPAFIGQQIVLATSGGRLLRFEVDEDQLPLMGRAAQGNQALRLRRQERLVGCAVLEADNHLLLVSERGYAKRMPVTALRLTNRGEIGIQAIQFTAKTDNLAAMSAALPKTEVLLWTNQNRLARLTVETVAIRGKDSPGDRLFPLNSGEKIATITVLETSTSSLETD
ncbi:MULTISPECIES: DNA gyrase subunit A [Trichocoleus]|uniref:DNA topoisomerase (ATP-hydrolyzing) n=1 Tax=Trichocoleus desertorum GB2-A4 TaxID=2933944 RepID=A0ABV0J4I4_9CYAN|nr:DNA gyrase subunit A [Trichocoleus sp. FACHB-46]MBD1860565.1 DNA gyrase subunit A [Trichocoleus sp. FACHB-46]